MNIPFKGGILLLMAMLATGGAFIRAENLSEADPDYIYTKKEKTPPTYTVKGQQPNKEGTQNQTQKSVTDKSQGGANNTTEYPIDTMPLPIDESTRVVVPGWTPSVDPKPTEEIVAPDGDTKESLPTERDESVEIEEIIEYQLDNKDKPEEFKREMETVDFVPKGQWIVGLSVSYTQSNQDKYQFLILEGISGNTYSFKISPTVMFAVKADLALGGRFSYNRSLTKVANADIVLDSETDYTFDHLYRLSHNYYGAAVMRNYFSLGKSKRFGLFNEVSFQLGGGQTKITTGVGEDLTGTYERNFSLNVGLTPGICVFLSNYSALEVNVGLLGFNYTNTRAVKDQIYVSHRNAKSANFRINLFSITFGATFYL